MRGGPRHVMSANGSIYLSAGQPFSCCNTKKEWAGGILQKLWEVALLKIAFPLPFYDWMSVVCCCGRQFKLIELQFQILCSWQICAANFNCQQSKKWRGKNCKHLQLQKFIANFTKINSIYQRTYTRTHITPTLLPMIQDNYIDSASGAL